MPHSRFFIDAPFKVAHPVVLEGEEAHHLLRVMRKKTGERVELVNGHNALAEGEILTCGKREVHLKITHVTLGTPASFSTILCQALCRPNRLDTIVEKGTELGMSELWLFPAELSEKEELTPSQLKRLEGIAIAAMKQSGRLDLPKILCKPPLIAWESPLPFPAYFGDTTPTSPPFLSLFKKQAGVLFFIGPESGFTPQEEKKLRTLNAQGVSLHPNILRTDTAPLAALSLISHS